MRSLTTTLTDCARYAEPAPCVPSGRVHRLGGRAANEKKNSRGRKEDGREGCLQYYTTFTELLNFESSSTECDLRSMSMSDDEAGLLTWCNVVLALAYEIIQQGGGGDNKGKKPNVQDLSLFGSCIEDRRK